MEGGCYCGAIRFRTNSEPYWIGACYCADCRKITGAPYAVYAGYKEDQFELIKGTPKDFQSSAKVTRSFCENCGSSITFSYIQSPNEPFVYIGTFDNPDLMVPKEHIFTESKLPWIHIGDTALDGVQ